MKSITYLVFVIFILFLIPLVVAKPSVYLFSQNITIITITQNVTLEDTKWIDIGEWFQINTSAANNINITGNINATSINASIDCSLLVGGSDADFCVDADTISGVDTVWQIDNTLVNNSDILGVNETWVLNLTNSTTYYPFNITTLEGTHDSGNLTSVLVPEDGDSFNVSEDAGASPLLIQINFTDVTTFDSVIGRIHYSGSQGHNIQLQILRVDTQAWENYIEFTDMSDFINFYVPIFDPENHVNGTNVTIRFDHDQSGISFHDFAIDYIALVEGFTALTVTDHDALGGRDLLSNHPQYMPTDASREFTGQINGTDMVLTGDMSSSNILSNYLNSSNIDSNDIDTELLNVTHNITLGNNRIAVGDDDLIIVLY